MRRGSPPRPSGNDREATFMQWVWDVIRELHPRDTPTVKWKSDSRGYYPHAITRGGGASKGSISVAYMTIVQVGGAAKWDYVIMNGGGQVSNVQVAKPDICRPSITSANWDGQVIDYVYSDDNHRVSTLRGQAPPNSQNEVLYPRITVGAKFPCIQFPGGTNVPGITWAFASEGFKWQRISNQ